MKEKRNMYILAYGGLRDGMSYCKFYQDVGHMKFIKTVELTGFNLYALGKMPVIRPARIIDGSDRVTCDIMECEESIFGEIYNNCVKNNFFMMRLMQKVKEESNMLPCALFVWKDGIADNYRVMSGDWWKFILKEKKDDNKKKEFSFENFVPSNN